VDFGLKCRHRHRCLERLAAQRDCALGVLACNLDVTEQDEGVGTGAIRCPSENLTCERSSTAGVSRRQVSTRGSDRAPMPVRERIDGREAERALGQLGGRRNHRSIVGDRDGALELGGDLLVRFLRAEREVSRTIEGIIDDRTQPSVDRSAVGLR